MSFNSYLMKVIGIITNLKEEEASWFSGIFGGAEGVSGASVSSIKAVKAGAAGGADKKKKSPRAEVQRLCKMLLDASEADVASGQHSALGALLVRLMFDIFAFLPGAESGITGFTALPAPAAELPSSPSGPWRSGGRMRTRGWSSCSAFHRGRRGHFHAALPCSFPRREPPMKDMGWSGENTSAARGQVRAAGRGRRVRGAGEARRTVPLLSIIALQSPPCWCALWVWSEEADDCVYPPDRGAAGGAGAAARGAPPGGPARRRGAARARGF